MHLPITINWFAVLVAGLLCMPLGMIWYSPKTFGTRWMAYVGLTPEKAKEDFHPIMIVKSLIANLILAFFLAVFFDWLMVADVAKGLMFGILFGLAFSVCLQASHYIWEKRPVGLFVIVAGYDITQLAIMGAVIGAWQ
ncbi:MAG: DUF1761 domain-containing protein [Deltaproteobacteria bacterium]|nr:DUF1761 domain-containing protein [Deltaproteobacteria bacterium]